jgi:hypothetical protein
MQKSGFAEHQTLYSLNVGKVQVLFEPIELEIRYTFQKKSRAGALEHVFYDLSGKKGSSYVYPSLDLN